MRLVDAALPTFARHETFHPRYGWFRKAYASSAHDPHVFTQPDAPVTMGVGKNMVRSIRFWGLASKLIVDDPITPNSRKRICVPTRFGYALFNDSGWDPYMEDPGTLWLLHWRLFAPPSLLPVWWLAFNDFGAVEFTDTDLEMSIATLLDAATQWDTPSQSSIKKDLGALLRSYAPQHRSRKSAIDDSLNCPLRELNLINHSAEPGRYRFTLGTKPALTPEVVAYTVLDWLARTNTTSNTVTLSRLANDFGSPGRVFKLVESELLDLLEPCVDATSELTVTTATGVVQLAWSEDPAILAPRLLDDYYDSPQPGVLAGVEGDRPIDDDLLEDLGFGRDPDAVMRRLHSSPAFALGVA